MADIRADTKALIEIVLDNTEEQNKQLIMLITGMKLGEQIAQGKNSKNKETA